MRLMPYVSLFLVVVLLSLYHEAVATPIAKPGISSQSVYQADQWADSVFETLTLEQQIGQLMMVAAYSNKGPQHKASILKLVKQYGIGGLIFFQGAPNKQLKLTNTYQNAASVPLLIGMDAEWGLSMRLDSTMAFPKQMTLGALENRSLIRRMGQHIARQCKRLGIHINFAPVVDINNNPQNPVIHMRSFGENPQKVANKAAAYLDGLQQGGVLGVAKHFPGHGDTDQDSHESLPILDHDTDRLRSTEFFPFRRLIQEHVGGVMSGHLAVPSFTGSRKLPASLSSKMINRVLKDSMNFEGLVFTDALNMKGVTQQHGPSQVTVEALKAGNDVLLYPEEVPKAINSIKNVIKRGKFSAEKLEKRVKKVLKTKYWAGLSERKALKPENLVEDLNKPAARDVKHQLIEEALTLVKNNQKLIPLDNLENRSIAAVSFGKDSPNQFHKRLLNYAEAKTFHLQHEANRSDFNQLAKDLKRFNTVILSIHNQNEYNTNNFGLPRTLIKNINQISQSHRSILVNFGSPYALKLFKGNQGVLQAYEDGKAFQRIAAQGLFGGFPFKGSLPVQVGERYEAGRGLQTSKAIRLNYTLPERVGIESNYLAGKVDSMANAAIEEKAAPGCQVLVAKQGNIIYNKAYGYYTYEKNQVVQSSSIYDIASITKIGATVPIMMRLYEKGQIHLDDSLGRYLTKYIDSIKKNLEIRELLTHQAGLVAWIPFYRYTLNERGFCDSNYCYDPNSFFSLQVADDLYLQESYRDSIWQIIANSEVEGRGTYNYSDLGFFYLKKILEQYLEVPLKDYLQHHFFKPLGMWNTAFLPIQHFPLSRIVPTERDDYFRHQLIHGYVHDPAAAMLGGIAGHAGLFSNVNDFAKLMQMFLNGGKYGGDTYFKPSTIRKFTSKQFEDNRKGLGFDKPETNPNKVSPTGELASPQTFGHTGFTGTCVWADPKHDLIYAFFSNRVHPTQENNKLVEMDIRTKIQDFIYRSFLSEEEISKRKSE